MSHNQTEPLNRYIQILRPTHWLKNAFVLAPLLFSREFRNFDSCVQSLVAAVVFCFISSAIYIFNDLCDRKEDQCHPEKKGRPIADGSVGVSAAVGLFVLLTLAASFLSIVQDTRFFFVVLSYAGMNILYSLWLKHVAILDVMILSAGFVLRILGGCLVINVEPSHWIVLCTIMITLFLGFTKRRTELVSIEQTENTTRKALRYYSIAFLDQGIGIVSASCVICYTLYTVDKHTLEVLGTRAMLITVPSVLYGLLRYIYLIYHKKSTADPVAMVWRDVPTLINLVLWVVLSFLAVGYGRHLDPFS